MMRIVINVLCFVLLVVMTVVAGGVALGIIGARLTIWRRQRLAPQLAAMEAKEKVAFAALTDVMSSGEMAVRCDRLFRDCFRDEIRRSMACRPSASSYATLDELMPTVVEVAE
jgi:hypothetical protein